MTVSTHTYKAFLIGSPDKELSVKGGSVTFNVGRSPHVQASLDVAFPGAWSTAPTTYTSWATQRTNLVRNPTPAVNLDGYDASGWGTGGAGTAARVSGASPDGTGWGYRKTWTTAPSAWNGSYVADYSGLGGSVTHSTAVPALSAFTLSVWFQAPSAGEYRIVPVQQDASGWGPVSYGPVVVMAAGEWKRLEYSGTMDPGMTHVRGSIFANFADPPVVGAVATVTRVMVEALPGPAGPYFDGATADADLYRYEWTGTANASTSVYQTRSITSHGGPVWTPDPATLAALDARNSARVRLEVSADFPTGTQTRTFDLGIRDQATSHADGTVSLPLASDEALALDYAPLADDVTPYTHQNSLVAVVNYALGKAITGAALEAGQPNPPIRALIDSTNLILDPGTAASAGGGFIPGNASLDNNDTSWSISGDGDSFNIFAPSTADSNLAIQTTSGVFPGVSAGRWYVLSATGNVKVALSGTSVPGDIDAATGTTLPRQRALVVFTRVGSAPYQIWHSPQVPNTINTPTRTFVKFFVPEGATEVFMRAYLGTTAGQIRWDGFRLSEATDDPTDTGYWDGDTTDTSEYAYAWTGAQDNSTSTRTALVDRARDLLTWRVGVSALDFLLPIVQAAGLRLVCDEQRRWTLRNEEYTATGSLSLRYGVNITAADENISRDGGLWFDAAVRRYRWRDSDGVQQERVDAYALTTPYTRLHTLDIDAPYPGPGRAEYAVRRAQQRGKEVSVSAVSDWTANPEQNLTILLPDSPIQVGSIQTLTFDLDSDEMTVTTRTTEIPAGAVDLLTGTVNALAGTVNAL